MSKKKSCDEKEFTAGAYTQSGPSTRCHHSHPILKINGGEVVGASCIDPRAGWDVYVGLDRAMSFTPRGWPWRENHVEQVLFPIQDRGVPGNPDEFKKMIEWICNQLQTGKRIHIGCMGGHGRTGLVIAAIQAHLGNKDAIQWARTHHCKKSVESETQVKFLMQLYGVSYVKGTDAHRPVYSGDQRTIGFRPKGIQGVVDADESVFGKYSATNQPLNKKATSNRFNPANSNKSIWGS